MARVLGEAMEQAPVGVAVFDRDLRFVQVNARLAAMNGRSLEAHVGRRPEELLPGLSAQSYVPVARRALAGEVSEAVEVCGETPAEPGATRHWLESWAPVRAPGGEVVGALAFVVEVTAHRQAEAALHQREQRDRVRAQALADLAADIAAATTVQRVAGAVAKGAAAAGGAAFSNLALLVEDGGRLQLHHHESLPDEIARRWSEVSLQDPVPLVDAVNAGEAVFVHDPSDNARRYPLLAEDTERAGLAATASIPVVDHGGVVLGAIGFAWSQPQRFGRELRALLQTITQLVGPSLERARLYEAEQRARERASVLAEATTAVGASGSIPERLQRICERLAPRFADLAIAELVPEAGASLPVGAAHGDPARLPALQMQLQGVDAYPSQGAARIVASGQAELLSDTSSPAGGERVPDDETLELLRTLGIRSYLGVPVRAGRAVIGTLRFGQTDSGRRFGTEDLAFAVDLGERVGLILDNVRLAEVEHEIAAELQQRLLPAALTAPTGTAVAARYRAGHARLAIGGDWYEVVGRTDGQVVVAVGDIVGHGARAAAAMGQVRSALTATSSTADGPCALLERLDDFATRTPDVQCSTACVAFLDPHHGDLRYACAGHPPPALLHPDGSVELLQGGRSWPLSAAEASDTPPLRTEAQASVPLAGRLVLYTDGLIERRDTSLDDGFARLLKTLRRHSDETMEPLCDAVLAEMLPEASGDDDAALLCIQCIGVDDNGGGAQGARGRR